MKFFVKTILLLLISQNGFSQEKSLVDFKKELMGQVELKKTNYIVLSRAISDLTINEKNETKWVPHYIIFLITNESGKTIVEEYQTGKKSKTFEINNSNIFKLLKRNIHKVKVEKLKNFEYQKDGSKVYLERSNSGEMEIDISFNQISYHNKFNDFLLEFSSNSKLSLVELILNIEHEFAKYYKNHPFYVETR